MNSSTSKGFSLHIGINEIDSSHYGSKGELSACESDAKFMMETAEERGFETKTLLTFDATRSAVANHIRHLAGVLNEGDIFLLSYSGHGSQVLDQNFDEADGADETWCLYDGELLDDEIFMLLSRFKSGVRILVFSDSCNSGTVLKQTLLSKNEGISTDLSENIYKTLPLEIAKNAYSQNKGFYDDIQSNEELINARKNIKASAILISGCQDNQLSKDGTFFGAFTAVVRQTWRNGSFDGDYIAFHQTIVANMNDNSQTPNYFTLGGVNDEFESQIPFTI